MFHNVWGVRTDDGNGEGRHMVSGGPSSPPSSPELNFPTSAARI